VVIATVFLTIIAMTGGYVLGEQRRNDGRSSGGGAVTPTEVSSPAFTPPGPFCLDEARRTAEEEGFTSELWQVLKVHVDRGNSTIWICTDRNNNLYYQGWTNTATPLKQHKNGLFLPKVQDLGDDRYKVVAENGNVLEVSATQLTVTFADGRETQRDKARVIE
jgi:hypothetical protein